MPTATKSRTKVEGQYRVRVDGVRQLDAEDQMKVLAQVQALENLPIEPGEIMLFDPIYPAYSFGPYGTKEVAPESPEAAETAIEAGDSQTKWQGAPNITFFNNVWVGSEEHPRLAALLKARPDLFRLRAEGEAPKVYSCLSCDFESTDKAKVSSHAKTAHKEV